MKWMIMDEELFSLCAKLLPKEVHELLTQHMDRNPGQTYVVYWNDHISRLSVGLHNLSSLKDTVEVTCITEFKEYILEKTLES